MHEFDPSPAHRTNGGLLDDVAEHAVERFCRERLVRAAVRRG
jgi:hypothetical protein